MPGVAYAVRRSMHSSAEMRKVKKAIRLAFQTQMQGLGFSIVEILGACPTNWHVAPADALDFIRDRMIPEYPVGDFKVDERLGD
jgi:2-oxoglutarate ferredoxin oxidoreductase subunit beta